MIRQPGRDHAQRFSDLQQLEILKRQELNAAKRTDFENTRAALIKAHVQENRQNGYTVLLMVAAAQEHSQSVVDGWIAIHRELALIEPRFASHEELTALYLQIESLIMTEQHYRRQTAEDYARGFPCSPSALDALADQFKSRDFTILANARNRIEQMKIEFRHGLYEPASEKNMQIELTNSTIHQLNLGTIVGDMNNAVTMLQQDGHSEVAEALKQLTERIAASDAAAQTKKEIVENLALVTEQAALPPEQRKQGVIKATLIHVKTALQTIATLTEVWKTYGPAIEDFFNFHP